MEAQTDPGGIIDPEPSQPWMFGGHLEPVRLPWTWATERLTQARNYWIATTRPDGQPHSRPVWGVWLDDIFYFSTGSLAEQNLATNPAITVHLESGSEVVIIEGTAEPISDAALVERVVTLYNQKYHWDVDPKHLPGPFYAMRPLVAFGWLSDASGLDRGAAFHGTATRWRFGRPPASAPSSGEA
jgi:nitroimidazol reductase NimA-like FMN-containing flavoprotein (pyridoxamine 5'-phosphate oxidase superfamily)